MAVKLGRRARFYGYFEDPKTVDAELFDVVWLD
jgi:hypothetical protein